MSTEKWIFVEGTKAPVTLSEDELTDAVAMAQLSYRIHSSDMLRTWESYDSWIGRELGAERAAVWPVKKHKLVEGKLKHDTVPPVALVELAKAMQDGARKYGRFNWRETGVSRADYYSAIMRHLLAWMQGEDVAADSGVSHLGHIMANCAIMLDGPLKE